MSTLIFVHGTGVREEAFKKSLSRISQKIHSLRSDITVTPCFWGDLYGAKLNKNGASIPNYDTARTIARPLSEEEFEIARWALLYDDPLFELRLLALEPAALSEFIPGRIPPYQQLDLLIKQLSKNSALEKLLKNNGLFENWDQAVTFVRTSKEYREAIQKTQVITEEYRALITRALVAALLQIVGQEKESFTNWINGANRDALVKLILETLDGNPESQARSVSTSWIQKLMLSIVSRYATYKITQRRGDLSDSTYPFAGDILLYQARGNEIRKFIRDTIQNAKPPVILLAHSLGGIASVDLLVESSLPKVQLLITVGSQASLLYEINALYSLPFGKPLPEHFVKRWLNFFDPQDFLSYQISNVFQGEVFVEDVKVNNEQPFPQSHSAYWDNDYFWQIINQRILL